MRRAGDQPPTFYKYEKRFAADGIDGLFEMSRRPVSSPAQTAAAVEDLVVGWRKDLTDQGWDAGAGVDLLPDASGRSGSAIGPHDPSGAGPSRSGDPQPAKRPRSSYRSFEYPRTNDCWQIDATECVLADGSKAVVFHLIDDCSRKSLGSIAAAAETGEAAQRCVSEAIARHGIPAMFLSDNGAAFSAKLRGGEAELERVLRALGVRVVTSSPYHPQTCGKDERLHQTFKKWLVKQTIPATTADLQIHAVTFDDLYSGERPHSSLDGATPDEIWTSRERCPEPTAPTDPSTRISDVIVSARGAVKSVAATTSSSAANGKEPPSP